MELLKKIVFFIVFFFTLVQATGNSNFRYEQKLFVIENHENEQAPTGEIFAFEFDEPEDQSSIITYIPSTCFSIIEQRIIEKKCHFHNSFNHAFWQPPK
jgi:hypothetical protein